MRPRRQIYRPVEQYARTLVVSLLHSQQTEAAVRTIQGQTVQQADTIRFEQCGFGFRKLVLLQVLFSEPVPTVRVELQVASSIRGIESPGEQPKRFGHTVLPGAQTGQLD